MRTRNPTLGTTFSPDLLQNPADNEILYLAVQIMEKKTQTLTSLLLLSLSLVIILII